MYGVFGLINSATNFCGIWNCTECASHRKRPHPRSKDANGQRFDICMKCDTKFLNLQLNHVHMIFIESYV